jgi:hypothetical protein
MPQKIHQLEYDQQSQKSSTMSSSALSDTESIANAASTAAATFGSNHLSDAETGSTPALDFDQSSISDTDTDSVSPMDGQLREKNVSNFSWSVLAHYDSIVEHDLQHDGIVHSETPQSKSQSSLVAICTFHSTSGNQSTGLDGFFNNTPFSGEYLKHS